MFVSKLLIGETLGFFIASFLGILLLGKTHKISWILITTAILLSFICQIIKVLSLSGIIPYDLSGQALVPLWYLILKLGSLGLLIVGIICEIIQKKDYY